MIQGQEDKLTINAPPAGVSAVGISTIRRPLISWIPAVKAKNSACTDWTWPGNNNLYTTKLESNERRQKTEGNKKIRKVEGVEGLVGGVGYPIFISTVNATIAFPLLTCCSRRKKSRASDSVMRFVWNVALGWALTAESGTLGSSLSVFDKRTWDLEGLWPESINRASFIGRTDRLTTWTSTVNSSCGLTPSDGTCTVIDKLDGCCITEVVAGDGEEE